MISASALVELGERYIALGLPAAAHGAFASALKLAVDGDARAARRLAELALAAGDGKAARDYAKEALRREPGPSTRVLLGRAHLLAGEFAAARFAFAAALEATGSASLIRARAHLGRAAAAWAEDDASGAAANIMAGLQAFCEFVGAPGRRPEDVEAELALAEELFSRAVAAGRADDVAEHLAELAARQSLAPSQLLSALLLSARQSHGEAKVQDSEIESALAGELARRPESFTVRLKLMERRLRRRHRDRSTRAEALAELESLVAHKTQHGASLADNIELARLCVLLAAVYEDDPGKADQAEALYRQGLALRPGHAMAANRLVQHTLARGDDTAALLDIEHALRVDATLGVVWRNAARVVDAAVPGPGMPRLVERLLDAADPGAGTAAGAVAARLVAATAEVVRGDVLAGVYTRGHRLKNVLSIIGSRARSARKLADEGELSQRLADLEREVTAVYSEWTTYLRSMETSGPVVEVMSAVALIAEVVEAASARSAVPIHLSIADTLPDLRGDRMLLREALLNIVSNAAEASVSSGGAVEVAVRAVTSGGTSIIEFLIADSGPGIPRADLARVFVPGFTTKETGSGVGLAIAERVVSGHHGRILIDSEEGRGTRVTVMLPTDLGGFGTLAALSSAGSEGPPAGAGGQHP